MTYGNPTCSHLPDEVRNEEYTSAYRGVTKGDLEELRYIIYGRKEDEAAKVSQ
jgi:hypothetical protein